MNTELESAQLEIARLRTQVMLIQADKAVAGMSFTHKELRLLGCALSVAIIAIEQGSPPVEYVQTLMVNYKETVDCAAKVRDGLKLYSGK